MSAHTPGPWEIGESNESMATVWAPAYDGLIARVRSPAAFDYATKNANALLIAAAPDLLAALRDCVAALGGIKSDRVPESALNAIEMATGEKT